MGINKKLYIIMINYTQSKKIQRLPRLPLEGDIDLTYRCNNNCRHCWLVIPADSPKKDNELSFNEITHIVDEARKMGCRHWSISGGEPMLRSDFTEIFDYITFHSRSYAINTNGTLITPKIARLLKQKGTKMVALYGATADVHDHITRNPGSFEATMRGFSYLKEADAGFVVQLVPMKDNYHQFNDMLKLAESLSKHCRIGASWLYLSACGDEERNKEILRQRLAPKEVVKLDKPDLLYEDKANKENIFSCHDTEGEDYLFSLCSTSRKYFHIDPYGKMSFCSFIKDPELRCDLRKESFQKCWGDFIPSLAKKIKKTEEYKDNCGSCELKNDCRCCPVYSGLEHGNFNARVDYLCAVAKENRKFKEEWKTHHRRYYKIADITIQIDSDLPITHETFHSKLKKFEVENAGEDTILISQHFELPDLVGQDLGKEVYRKTPWAIYKKRDAWIYLGIVSEGHNVNLHKIAVFNSDYTRGKIYNDGAEAFSKGNISSLTFFPTDQILLGRILADRNGCFLHSSGVILQEKGLLFAGHSEAGKSTMATMLKGHAEILCDDRIIIRKASDGFRIYGTWHHGDVPDVSSSSAPLKAIMFLEQSDQNRIVPLQDKKEIARRLLDTLIRSFVTHDWWEKMLVLIDTICETIPCYMLSFDLSGDIIHELKKI
ncbi:radical SAM protein [Candidatus Omnitrophota bacterium]